MRPFLLPALVAALAVSCAKRIAPSAPAERTVRAGVPLELGLAQELPDGTRIRWTFDDGSPPADGPRVRHSFARPGAYAVVETVTDKEGQRAATSRVTVLPRPAALAVPADARAVLLVEAPWSKLSLHRATADRVGLGGFYDEVARSLGEALGFDALDPAAASANGFDPSKGVALYTLPQDPEALVFVAGTSDDARALESVRRVLARPSVGRLQGGPFVLAPRGRVGDADLWTGQGPKGDRVGVLQRFGYLYLRMPGATEPALALQTAASLPPEPGLSAEPSFAAALRHVGKGDAVFWSRAAADGAGSRISDELGATAFSMVDGPDALRIAFFGELRNLRGEALAAAFRAARPPPDLAGRLPAGAAAYLQLSAAPQALWQELTRASGADATRVHDRLQEATGLDLERDLLPSFTGNLGVGVYLDASAFLEAILGEQVGSFDRSAFVLVAELERPDALQAVLDRAVSGHESDARVALEGGAWLRLGEAAQAAVKDGFFYLAVGGPPPKPPAPPGRKPGRARKPVAPEQLGLLGPVLLGKAPSTLGDELRARGLSRPPQAGEQLAWLDVQGVAGSIERAADAQGGVAGAAARALADRVAQVRDLVLSAHAAQEGVEGELDVRFPPPAGGR